MSLSPVKNPFPSISFFCQFSSGGVLEPAGTVEIKFKMKDLAKAMRRLDDTYSILSKKLASPGKQSLAFTFHLVTHCDVSLSSACRAPILLFGLIINEKCRHPYLMM